MRVIQFREGAGVRAAVVESESIARVVELDGGVYAAATSAIRAGDSLESTIVKYLGNDTIEIDDTIARGALTSPIIHADPAHCIVTGTGLTHLGSAGARSAMHAAGTTTEELTDSMRMFNLGVDGGRPRPGQIGAQPEWFYKGDGSILVAPESELPVPSFALDAGEEPELAGVYVVGPDGRPWRVGFALGNEFSDHVTERFNYLWLAHSKLRACSVGPELVIGEIAGTIEGESRIVHDGEVIWRKPFLTGEETMAHSIANLEHHHFKYPHFRRPGDVHIHFFGTATLSFADGITVEHGDSFEIEAPGFGRPLRNTVSWNKTNSADPVVVGVL
ncbi:MAG: FAH family protein [Spirochaetaceae bacterium]|nr:MAG: FAH family protein [Spirochaetaceae bacterium]